MKSLIGDLTTGGHDLTCPFCGESLGVNWKTNDGDPVEGEAESPCPKCGSTIQFETEKVWNYHPYRWQGQ